MAIQSNFPSIRPSLLLDFANSKRLDPRVTFTRASTATYYDGVTVAKAEENLFTRSQEFDNTTWTKTATTVTADQTTAPDGTSTADLLASAATTATHSLTRSSNISITSGLTYVFSAFLKKGSGATAPDIMQLAFSTGSSAFAATAYSNFNINTGTVGTTGAGATASIVDAGGGWYRCSIIATAGASVNSSAAALIAFTNNDDALGRVPNYAALATDDVFVWGAQLEQRSALTAYTATTTQAITNYVPQLLTAAANVARFDHTPTTGESLGLLVEESRQNLVTYSEQFDNAAWTTTGSSISANATVAPSGSVTADALVESTAASAHYVQAPNASVTSGTSYTASVFAKANGRVLQLTFNSGGFGLNAWANFDLSSGAVGTVGSSTTASIQNVGNGWYRCVATAAATATTSSSFIVGAVTSSTAARAESYTGDGYKGLFIWGAQLEAGAFATSYIPTVASAVTRSADAALMTGTNFSSWYNASEGTIYADMAQFELSATQGFAFNDGTTNNRLVVRALSVSEQARVVVNTTNVATLDAGTPVANVFGKYALAYKVNDFALSLNGGAVATDASGAVPVVSQFSCVATGIAIRKIAYYPLRLTDAQLQAITG